MRQATLLPTPTKKKTRQSATRVKARSIRKTGRYDLGRERSSKRPSSLICTHFALHARRSSTSCWRHMHPPKKLVHRQNNLQAQRPSPDRYAICVASTNDCHMNEMRSGTCALGRGAHCGRCAHLTRAHERGRIARCPGPCATEARTAKHCTLFPSGLLLRTRFAHSRRAKNFLGFSGGTKGHLHRPYQLHNLGLISIIGHVELVGDGNANCVQE